MAYDSKTLRKIYDRTDGRCHLCGKKLSLSNYGQAGKKAPWHVEHSVARARGGTDHLNNLFPACIGCNLDKSTASSRTVRGRYGRSRAPLSKAKKNQLRKTNAGFGAIIGGVVGGLLGGPPGAVLGAAAGGALGHSSNPETS